MWLRPCSVKAANWVRIPDRGPLSNKRACGGMAYTAVLEAVARKGLWVRAPPRVPLS